MLLAAALFGLPPAAAAGQPTYSAAAPGRESTLRQADMRVAEIAYRLALAGAPRCSHHYPLTGLLFHHLAEYEPPDRALITSTYRLDRGPGILTVLGGSPAARAGLVAGDVLLAADGAAFPSPIPAAAEPNRKAMRKMLEAAEMHLEERLKRGPAELTVLRSGRELRLTLDSLSACQGRVRLARSTQMNAFANGRYVVMTTSMLDYLRSDDELAVVLGHELAHNILRHEALRDEGGLPDEGLLRSLGIKPGRLWRNEAEADRLGLRLMAAAGYDLSAAIPFWRRYLRKYDWFPQIFRTHPGRRARERIANEEIESIRREAAARAGP